MRWRLQDQDHIMTTGSVSQSQAPSAATSMLGMDTLFYAADAASLSVTGVDDEKESAISEEDKAKVIGQNGDGVGGAPVDDATYQRMMGQGAQVG
jgi:hypothetical protein